MLVLYNVDGETLVRRLPQSFMTLSHLHQQHHQAQVAQENLDRLDLLEHQHRLEHPRFKKKCQKIFSL